MSVEGPGTLCKNNIKGITATVQGITASFYLRAPDPDNIFLAIHRISEKIRPKRKPNKKC